MQIHTHQNATIKTMRTLGQTQLAAAAVLMTTVAAAAFAAPPQYYVTDLGRLGSGESVAVDANDFGEVVGWSDNQQGFRRPFLWRNGTMINLGTLPGEADASAEAINIRGQVVGRSGNRGFIWEDGVMTELPTLPGGSDVHPADINDLGIVAGEAIDAQGHRRGFIWDSVAGWSSLLEIDAPDDIISHSARAINIDREVATDGVNTQFEREAWRSYYSTFDGIPGLGGDAFSRDINNAGWMVGYRDNQNDVATGYLWQGPGNIRTILPVAGYADQFQFGMNDLGDSAGFSRRYNGSTFEYEATIYLKGENKNYELESYLTNPGDWDLSFAYQMNDNGQIVGWGTRGNSDDRRAFLLTPVPQDGFVFLPDAVNDEIHVLEPKNGTPLGKFSVASFAASPFEVIDGDHGGLLLSDNGNDQIWELTVWGAKIGTFNNAPVDQIRGITRSLGGYIVGSTPTGLKAWNANGDEVATGVGGNMWDVEFLNLQKAKRYLASNVDLDNVQAFDLSMNPKGQTKVGDMNFPEQVAIMSGLRFAVASHANSRICIFDLRTGDLITSFVVDGQPRGVFQSTDSRLLVSTSTGLYQYYTSGTLHSEIMSGGGLRYLSQCKNYNPF